MSPLSHGVGAFCIECRITCLSREKYLYISCYSCKNMHIGFTVAAGCATITEVLYFFIFGVILWSKFAVTARRTF